MDICCVEGATVLYSPAIIDPGEARRMCRQFLTIIDPGEARQMRRRFLDKRRAAKQGKMFAPNFFC